MYTINLLYIHFSYYTYNISDFLTKEGTPSSTSYIKYVKFKRIKGCNVYDLFRDLEDQFMTTAEEDPKVVWSRK